jgi:PAS domain S-box-containing protein
VNAETQAVLVNAVPLLVLAALYLAVTAALLPAFARERKRLRDVEFAVALMFPCIGVAALVFGVLVLIEREPIEDHPYVFLVAVAIAFVPALAFLANWSKRGEALSGTRRAREAEAVSSDRERELEAVSRLSRGLVGAQDEAAVGRLLVDEALGVFGVDLATLAVIDEGATEARYVEARQGSRPVDWLTGSTLSLTAEPSGIASAVAAREAFAVADAASSTRVNRRLVERAGVRSAVFVPLLSGERVSGVLVAGSAQQRVFTLEELEALGALAAEAALALERLGVAAELEEALDRERLIGRIASDVRSELDLDRVLEVTVRDVAEALGLSRCLVRLGTEPLAAEWSAEGLDPVGDRAHLLPVSNLAETDGATVAVAEAALDSRLDAAGRDTLAALGTGSALATPILVDGQAIGVLTAHRAETGPWSRGAAALLEAVARETGLAIRTAQLVAENRRRLAEQAALVEASHVLAGETSFDAVMRRIVDELVKLLRADAADSWILEHGGRRLRCRAVHGLPASEVGRVIAAEGTIGEAIATRRPVLRRRFAETEQPPPSPTYAVFAEAMDAPIVVGNDVRGVLGVCSLEHGRFDENDLVVLEAFARLAAVAFRNAEALEESRRQTSVQRGFARIALVLSEPLSSAETLDAVAQAATEALEADSALVLSSVGDGLRLAGGHNLRDEVRAALVDGVASEALRHAADDGRMLASVDLATDDRFADWLNVVRGAGARSLLAVPVDEARAARHGLVVAFFAEQRSFSDDDLELAGRVAVAARGALERSAVFEVERRSRGLAQQLASTGRTLASELDPAAVLDEMARQLTVLLGTEGATVRLLERDELVVHAATGPGSNMVLGARSPSTSWLAGEIISSRDPAVVADTRQDDRHEEADPLVPAGGYRGYLGAPLIGTEGAVHGVLAALSREPREWHPDEVDALLAFAGTASAALSNAELYQRVALAKGQSEAILANVADGIVAVDREGDVVLWNRAAERITGVPAGDAIGRPPHQILGRALAPTGEGLPGRLVPVRRSGDDVWLSVTEAVMTDPAGAVAGRIFTFRDISDERVVEQMKTEFVSAVSHELRTPLTSIYGFAETLLREDVQFGDEERRTFLRYIASESERLTTIVDTLLSVARLEGGDIQVRLAPTDVSALVTEAVRTVETALGGNGHRFEAEVSETPLDAEADREKLRQVLAILLDNAVRYSPSGGRVLVAAERRGDAVEVRVEDEGIGIPVAEIEHIFRKFYRGEAGSRLIGTGNTGLGLFIAEGLVTAMGGRIWVDSSEGTGSVFGVELPAARTEPGLVGVEAGGGTT